MRTSIPPRLASIIAQQTNPAARYKIEPGATLRDDLALDELAVQSIAIEADSEFHIEIRDHELRAWQTVADVAATVEKHAGATA